MAECEHKTRYYYSGTGIAQTFVHEIVVAVFEGIYGRFLEELRVVFGGQTAFGSPGRQKWGSGRPKNTNVCTDCTGHRTEFTQSFA